MQKTQFKNKLSLIVCIVLIAAMALLTTGCNGNTTNDSNAVSTTAVSTTAVSQSTETVLGDGATEFTFTVTDSDGKETSFEIHTNKTTVGDALLELDLIAGEDGPYGLYVKTVNGITVDYDTDGKYWAFYQNGEYATAGVDATEITAGATYSFKVE
ncbi:MAG: DUF4430 domain-containing protein [Clostridia bacterium]|nr:DUF4430 domain-containing protein [Clostridia bacterium]MEE1025335.1 DUF4430 domain-containing protein [Acutalibacteraceae bacterium]